MLLNKAQSNTITMIRKEIQIISPFLQYKYAKITK